MTRFIPLLLLMSGCGATFSNIGKDTTHGVISVATDEESKKKIDSLLTDAVKSARDEALGATTQKELDAIVTNLKVQIKIAIQEALSDPATLRSIDQAREELVGAPIRADGDALREELFGAPLQQDLNNLIDGASPHLIQAIQGSVATIKIDASGLKTQADNEAAKWKPIAIGFAVGSGFLLVSLVVACFLLHYHMKMKGLTS
jgi:hypothetical protein